VTIASGVVPAHLRALLSVLAVLVLSSAPAASQKAPQKAPVPKVERFAGTTQILLLRDVDRNATLFARNADRAFAPASLVKVMTAYTVLERVRLGKATLDTQVTVPAALVQRWQKWPRASSLRLRAGEKVSINDLLHGMITASGNDAAELLAISIDGNVDDFVARMNRQAVRIGMKSSRFGTVTGWPDGGRTKVTARDMALLAERLLSDHPDAYRRYFGTKRLTRDNGASFTNRNPLLGRVDGADGFKTGHTSEAGYTLIGSARRDGRRLVVVLAGAKDIAQRANEGAELIEAGFAATAPAKAKP
jgi:serine-type D-Ala-D-Ala carboxypeptidase (penicillin-binding protein 5/6)